MILLENAKLQVQDNLVKGVVETFNMTSEVFNALEFVEVGALVYKYNQVDGLPDVGYRSINAGYDESTAIVKQCVEELAIFGGDADVDFQLTLGQNINDLRAIQTELKTKATAMRFERDFFLGAGTSNTLKGLDARLKERIAGTEEEFVNMMNNKVKELGLNDTNFKNSHGLDAANHYSSAYDMSIIAKELVKHEKILEYSRIYEMYLRENTDRKIWLVNTNKLVRFYNGVDGLKTGYTKEAGYCLTATAKKNDMRIITVVMGEPDSSTRNSEVTGMLDYAFSQYEIEKLLSKESTIGETLIEKGTNKYVKLAPTSDVTVLNKKINGKKNATYEVEVDNIIAPVTKGSIVGKLHIKEDDNLTRTIDITVSEDVKKANLFELYLRYLKEILIGDVGI